MQRKRTAALPWFLVGKRNNQICENTVEKGTVLKV